MEVKNEGGARKVEGKEEEEEEEEEEQQQRKPRNHITLFLLTRMAGARQRTLSKIISRGGEKPR